MYYGTPELVILQLVDGEITMVPTNDKSKAGYYSSQYLRVAKVRSDNNSMISADEYNETVARLNSVDPRIIEKARRKWLKANQGFRSYSEVLDDLYGPENNWPEMFYDTSKVKNKAFGKLKSSNLIQAFNIQPGQTGRGEYLLASIFPNLVVIYF